MNKKIGVILADVQEYIPFKNYFSEHLVKETKLGGDDAAVFELEKNGKTAELIAVHCGIGKVNAANAAAALIYSFGVDTVLNAGLSGAVSKVNRGDIVAGTEYVECDVDLRAIGFDWGVKPDEEKFIRSADAELLKAVTSLENYKVKTGRLGTGDIFLADTKLKNEIKEQFSVVAFDMETGAIGTVCEKNGTAFLSIRKVSDDADDSSKDDYREMNDKQEVVLSQIVKDLVMKII